MTDSGPAAGVIATPAAGTPPCRADGVVLIGEMQGSGYRVAPALARRGDGQTVQLTPLLYALLELVDGRRDAAALATALSASTGRQVSPDNVDQLLAKLDSSGLLDGADQDQHVRSNPLLALKLKVAVSDPDRTRRLTTPFARLFSPLLAVPVLAGFAFVCWWVLFSKGLASATHEAFARPGLLLLVLAVTVFSAGFHEFGHAAAARRAGATPGVMGVGLYLVWPAFYTDVTDSYRLDRWGRLRTDLGGLYFNAIVALATVGVWLATEFDALLLVVATQILQMLRQLLPLVRFDGYHVLADLTGVPDLFQRIGPTLKALVPGLPRDPAVQALKPWARVVITLWVLTVVPVFAAVLVLLVLALPRVIGTALAAADAQAGMTRGAADAGDVVAMLAHGLSALVVLLPVAAIVYLLVRLSRRTATSVWQRTDGRPARRLLAILVATGLVAGLSWAWWPQEDRYRPVQAYEGGTVGSAFGLVSSSGGLAAGSEGSGTIALPAGADLPTAEDPALAVVLVPHDGGRPLTTTTDAGDEGGSDDGSVTGDAAAPDVMEQGDVDEVEPGTWVFPFDEPLAPDADDNQAVAVNTSDGTTTYDVAFALVWADGSQPVQTDNEAYALASCSDCTAVAVAFQVVLVVGEAAQVAPANISVAANYDCSNCLTYSLAVQLFVTLNGPLSEAAMAELESLWAEVSAFGENIGDVPLDEIQDVLSGFEAEILAIVEADQGPLGGPTDSPSPSGSPTGSPTATSSPGQSASTAPAESGSSSPSPSTSASTSDEPSSEPSPTASTSPSSTPSSSPSSTPSTSEPTPSGGSAPAATSTP